MAQYSEDGKVVVPPPGMKVTYREWDDMVREADPQERYFDEPVYSFGGGKAEVFEEAKRPANGDSPRRVIGRR